MKDIKDLERFCMEEWSTIPPNVFSNLINNFRKRLSAIILAKGGCQSIEHQGANNIDPYLFEKKLPLKKINI